MFKIIYGQNVTVLEKELCNTRQALFYWRGTHFRASPLAHEHCSGITGQRKLFRNMGQTCSANGIKLVHKERSLEDT